MEQFDGKRLFVLTNDEAKLIVQALEGIGGDNNKADELRSALSEDLRTIKSKEDLHTHNVKALPNKDYLGYKDFLAFNFENGDVIIYTPAQSGVQTDLNLKEKKQAIYAAAGLEIIDLNIMSDIINKMINGEISLRQAETLLGKEAMSTQKEKGATVTKKAAVTFGTKLEHLPNSKITAYYFNGRIYHISPNRCIVFPHIKEEITSLPLSEIKETFGLTDLGLHALQNAISAENRSVQEKVRKLKVESGLSYKKFYEIFGIPPRTLENWEKGLSVPPAYVVELLEFKMKHLVG